MATFTFLMLKRHKLHRLGFPKFIFMEFHQERLKSRGLQHLECIIQCCCDWKAQAACAQSFTLAASNNRVHTLRSLYYCMFVPRISVFFFVYIPSVVNHTFNAMPAERLQRCSWRL